MTSPDPAEERAREVALKVARHDRDCLSIGKGPRYCDCEFDEHVEELTRALLAERRAAVEECAKVADDQLYEPDEEFLAKRGDEERIPYEAGQSVAKRIARAIRSLAPADGREGK